MIQAPAAWPVKLPPLTTRLRWQDPDRLAGPGQRDRLAVGLAACVVILDMATYFGGLRMASWGAYLLLPSLVPASLLALRCGRRLIAPDQIERRAWRLPLGLLLAIATAAGWWYVTHVPGAQLSDPAALALQTAGEELSFRLAWPLVLAVVLARRLGWRRAFVAGYLLAGVMFCCTPGHVAQFGGPFGPLPWIAFAGLAAWVVARSGAVLATAAAHAVLDLLAFDSTIGHLPAPVYGLGASVALAILALAAVSVSWVSGRLVAAPLGTDTCRETTRRSEVL